MKLSFFFIVLYMGAVRSEMFTSYEEMKRLADSQHQVAEHLSNFVEFCDKRLNIAKKIVGEFKKFSQESSKQTNIVGNPVNAFLLIKLMVKDLQNFVDSLNTMDELKKFVRDIKEDVFLPDNEDYEGVIKAMHRLEDTYLIQPNDIRLGNLKTQHPSRPLSAFECFELGRIAYENKDYYHAVRWMNESLVQLEIEGDSPSVSLVQVLDYYAFTTAKQGNIKHALDLTKKLVSIEPDHERARYNIDYFEKELKDYKKKLQGELGDPLDLSINPYIFKNPRPEHALGLERDVYEALCRGDPIPGKVSKNLYCRYASYHPMLKIAPVKEELINDNPKIWLYHEIITENQIEIMKNLARPKLKRAIVRSPITGQYETAEYRISKSGWLTDNEHPTLRFLTSLLGAVTNLSMSTAEEWQIANYGIGGQYEPHFDFARKSDPGDAFGTEIGNRIATWLFYLDSPEVGGATVFPPIGIRVNPIRRSAAFWYNLYPSGDGDYRTRHAACPVLFGTKWVSNKWIHMVGQEFLRKCNLKREDSPEVDY
ncbi:prolyl 4-hydroxylase subunit alpha-2 [Brachionus plicatilis]|uniref:procollagen-proline 4-dioxygenase n=1 Tax=Brachionus plicatilis TaxID=10195 RepID=A0A3M7QGW0_BRAPC|nr:prolyl 4-hydroxylase subunit alpha-2 [Brachionus plicatilis]